MLSAHQTQNFLWRYQSLLTLIWDKKPDETSLSGSINAHMLQKINTGDGGETEGTFIHCWWKSKLVKRFLKKKLKTDTFHKHFKRSLPSEIGM